MADQIVSKLAKVCPECGVSLEGKDLQGHALSHYPDYLDPQKSSKVAIKRKAQLLAGGVSASEYQKSHEG